VYVKSHRDDAKYNVAFGANANQASIFNHHDGTDVPIRHQLGSFIDQRLRRRLEDASALHHASSPLIEHRTRLKEFQTSSQ